MSAACWCGSCHGCRLAWEAGERYDNSEEEAREKAERDEREEALAEYLDDYPKDQAA